MRHSCTRRQLILICALLFAAGRCHAETVDVICSVREWCDVVRKAFTEATGIEVNMTTLGSDKTVDLLIEQRERPKHDLWYGGTGEFHLQAAELRLTLPYRSPNNALLHDWGIKLAEQTGYRTNGLFSGPLQIVYNAKLLASASVAPPRCWADLLKPEYRNKIQLADPYGVYSVITTMVQLKGEDAAFEYLRKLHANIESYPATGLEALANLGRGEAVIVIAFAYGASASLTAGQSVETATPCEGTGYEIGGMSIIKGGPNPNGAKRFFDWALTRQAQKLMSTANQFQVPSNRSGGPDGRIVIPSATRLIDYDFVRYGSLDERKRLLDKWRRIVAEAPRR